jgi:hypothetical protein
MKIIKRALFATIVIAITSCSTSTTLLSQNSNYGHNNYKYFPYKSAIIKYEFDRGGDNYKRVRVWDNWGVQWWEEKAHVGVKSETEHNVIRTRTIQFRNNGTEFYVNYRHKKIRKSRAFNQDELLVANQNLR